MTALGPVTGWTRDALVSDDGRYRYTLSRRWAPENGDPITRPVVWIGLNPSTADALTDDATVRRIRDFTRRFGHNAFTLVNLFALRSRHPGALLTATDPVGQRNNAVLGEACTSADLVVAAWGALPFAQARAAEVVNYLRMRDVALWCLGRTVSGAPRHPLYLSNATRLEELP